MVKHAFRKIFKAKKQKRIKTKKKKNTVMDLKQSLAKVNNFNRIFVFNFDETGDIRPLNGM